MSVGRDNKRSWDSSLGAYYFTGNEEESVRDWWKASRKEGREPSGGGVLNAKKKESKS